MEKNAIEILGLKKSYGSTLALQEVNLSIKKGEFFGLLGPNGAGKTTFLSILGGTVLKTEGKINVWGFDLDKNPRQVKASIGIVPQEINLDAFFSPKNLLELQAGLYGVPKKDRITETILKMVALEDKANAYSRSLSGGMKRRLLIAKAMVHQPPILVLDEPTAGVDVELRKNLWDNVKELNKEGVTIILTTHYLFEAQEMCDRIAILDKGSLVALDTTQKLLDRIQTKKVTFKIKNIEIDRILSLKNVEFKVNHNSTLTAIYEKNVNKFEDILHFLKTNNLEILDIITEDSDLEDIFVQLTNR